MADAAYYKTVTNKSTFKKHFKAEQRVPFIKLDHVAAHKWGRPELFGLAVKPKVVQHLPVLSEFTPPSNEPTPKEIEKFINGPGSDYMSRSEHSLVRDPIIGESLGRAWAALASFTAPRNELRSDEEDDAETGSRSKRTRIQTTQEDYVDSSMMRVDSSSSNSDESKGTPSSVGYVDKSSSSARARKENETLRLFSCVTRHVLHYAFPQENDFVDPVVEFRDYASWHVASTPNGGRRVAAMDDRGLVLREFDEGRLLQKNDYVMLVEAKSEFQRIVDGKPILTDECLGQMTCEAMAARLKDFSEEKSKFKDGSVIIAHPTQQYVCFLQFDVTDSYLEVFEENFDLMPPAFLRVYITRYLDLSTMAGRKAFVATMSSLMIWAREN
ncbi:hypothetical protein C2857_004574 [Epichloe festucae Fl1]|uniref:Uncharacterized protein n=1 Tax=Epichloe festucae (strain Fl1) TaxID=877507 RepID=A0A7U3SMZ6_EPIFF|nr:hypothetical protein C2857_004574 [Epichloe festucae Fl1]